MAVLLLAREVRMSGDRLPERQVVIVFNAATVRNPYDHEKCLRQVMHSNVLPGELIMLPEHDGERCFCYGARSDVEAFRAFDAFRSAVVV